MSESSKRDEWDQHNRDEAKERAAQQAAAGPTHRPVPMEQYAHLGGAAAALDGEADPARLMADYERASEAERLAWRELREHVAAGRDARGWDAWRDAVEVTQKAARRLVDYGTGHTDAG